MTPARIEAQHRQEWHSDAVFIVGLWAIIIFFIKTDLLVGAFVTLAYGLWFGLWLAGHGIDHLIIKKMMAGGVLWDDGPNYMWEKRTRRNEPWRVRVFP